MVEGKARHGVKLLLPVSAIGTVPRMLHWHQLMDASEVKGVTFSLQVGEPQQEESEANVSHPTSFTAAVWQAVSLEQAEGFKWRRSQSLVFGNAHCLFIFSDTDLGGLPQGDAETL